MSAALSRLKIVAAPALFALAALAIVTLMLWPLLSETFHGRHQSEREVGAFVASVKLGQAAADVERVLREGRYQKLSVRSKKDHEWWLTTPSQLGASDWIVKLEFEDRRVVSVRVGSSDQANVTPSRAPAPKHR
ncbi:MAG: hypothetical protein ABIT71_09490 [Vicinamibacteraceae bacterium]